MPTDKNIYDDIRITDKPNLDSSSIAASAKAVKSVYDTTQLLDDKITSKLDVIDIDSLSDLTEIPNGWYSISEITLAGITSDWVIAKFGVLCTATSTKNTRIVLNSINPTNVNEWYSPYAYWHA
jgi:hypothetical protein